MRHFLTVVVLGSDTLEKSGPEGRLIVAQYEVLG
jgi:hypothetical protein